MVYGESSFSSPQRLQALSIILSTCEIVTGARYVRYISCITLYVRYLDFRRQGAICSRENEEYQQYSL